MNIHLDFRITLYSHPLLALFPYHLEKDIFLLQRSAGT